MYYHYPFLVVLLVVVSCKKQEKIYHKPYDIDIKSDQEDILDKSFQNESISINDYSTKVEEENEKLVELESNSVQSTAVVKNQNDKIQKERVLTKRSLIKFEEPIYIGGEIIEGDVIKHQFKFSNTGKYPLEIIKAEGTCGCTVPSFPFLAIEPGGEGYIGVIYHSVGKVGEQSPEIVVTTNAVPSKITLKMKLLVLDKESQREKSSGSRDSLSIGI